MLGGDGGRAQAGLSDRAAATGPKVDRAVARLRGRFERRRGRAARAPSDDRRGRGRGLQRDGPLRRRRRGSSSSKASRSGRRPTRRRSRRTSSRLRPARRSRSSRGELKKDAPLAKAVATGHGDGPALGRAAARGPAAGSREQFKLHGARAEPEACRLLAELVGDDLYELASEVDKLATWAGGSDVTAADVEALVAPRAEIAAVGADRRVGRPATSAGCCARPSGCSTAPATRVSKTIPRLVGSLTKHVAERARRASALEDAGRHPGRRGGAARDEAVPGAEALRPGAELQRRPSSTTRSSGSPSSTTR